MEDKELSMISFFKKRRAKRKIESQIKSTIVSLTNEIAEIQQSIEQSNHIEMIINFNHTPLDQTLENYESKYDVLHQQFLSCRELVPEYDKLLRELRHAVRKLRFTIDEQLFRSVDKIRSYESDTRTNVVEVIKSISIEDSEEVENITLDAFIDYIQHLPLHIRKQAYQCVLSAFLLDVRDRNISHKLFLRDLADYLHNVPSFLEKDLQGLDDRYFWDPVFRCKYRKKYLLTHFCVGLKLLN